MDMVDYDVIRLFMQVPTERAIRARTVASRPKHPGCQSHGG